MMNKVYRLTIKRQIAGYPVEMVVAAFSPENARKKVVKLIKKSAPETFCERENGEECEYCDVVDAWRVAKVEEVVNG